jgi:multidrug efflux pump subunit AcrA (membrane-fusion protein)
MGKDGRWRWIDLQPRQKWRITTSAPIRPTDWIGVDGRHEPIRAGMRVSAEIKTGSRRVIEYLLSPVMQAVKEAGRER